MKADPCLLVKKDEIGVVYIGVWVDDSLIVGDLEAIDKVILDLRKQGLQLK